MARLTEQEKQDITRFPGAENPESRTPHSQASQCREGGAYWEAAVDCDSLCSKDRGAPIFSFSFHTHKSPQSRAFHRRISYKQEGKLAEFNVTSQ
jgi:hypothetical protein